MREYNKLVRDKIPEIMKQNGAEPVTMRIHPNDFINHLNKKLQEEVNEYLEEGNRVEELVDIATVIMAILEYKGVTFYDFVRMYSKKLENKGGFKDKIFLVKGK